MAFQTPTKPARVTKLQLNLPWRFVGGTTLAEGPQDWLSLTDIELNLEDDSFSTSPEPVDLLELKALQSDCQAFKTFDYVSLKLPNPTNRQPLMSPFKAS